MTYEMDIAGLKRDLPLCKLTDDLSIGAFVIFGDVELTEHCAAELLKRAPEYDYMIAPEAKAIPLVYEMARQARAERYFVARKGAKAYMQGTFEVTVRSITTKGVQHLVLDAEDAAFIKGKRMLIVDDVISTGESLHAVEELVEKAIEGAKELIADEDSDWQELILRMDYSARKKLHIWLRLPVGKTIAETQELFCQEIGIPKAHDESCTTPERFIFLTGIDEEIYRSPLWLKDLSDEEIERLCGYLDIICKNLSDMKNDICQKGDGL